MLRHRNILKVTECAKAAIHPSGIWILAEVVSYSILIARVVPVEARLETVVS
jgi:hypothetical protein